MLRIKPQGKQKEVLALPAKGHIIVLGTAGAGKTTIALLRAINLANLPGDERVLVVTFNGALVKYMQGISKFKSPKLTIEKYHKFAMGYLASRGKMPKGKAVLDDKRKYIQMALDECREEHPGTFTLKRSVDFFVEEIGFIQKFGFKTYDEYYQAERIGRGSANIKRDNRRWIYDVYEKYMDLRKKDGYTYDWDDLAFYVYEELKRDSDPRRYTHIIVDEGQDFSPMMIRSLVHAAAPDGSFTFMGDVAQQIYGNRLSWRDSGIRTEKIWRFGINYRNPETILSFARDITESGYWIKDGDMVDSSAQAAEGPKPLLVRFQDWKSEFQWVVQQAISVSQTTSVVIVCKRRRIIDLFMDEFKRQGVRVKEVNKNTPAFADTEMIYVSTFHAAKGLEFEYVFIPFLSETTFPDKKSFDGSQEKEDVYANELRLLYVAVTRSRYGLFMSYHDKLSPLFPKESENYEIEEL